LEKTVNRFPKHWSSHPTLDLSGDHKDVVSTQRVILHHGIEKQISFCDCFIVAFVEQPRYDYVSRCENQIGKQNQCLK